MRGFRITILVLAFLYTCLCSYAALSIYQENQQLKFKDFSGIITGVLVMASMVVALVYAHRNKK